MTQANHERARSVARPASDSLTALIACHDCDLLHRVLPIDGGGVARCCRCNALLYLDKPGGRRNALHLTMASLILLVLAITFPFMSFSLTGRTQHGTLMTGIGGLYDQGFYFLSMLVLLATIVAPAVRIGGLLYVLGSLHFGHEPALRKLVGRFTQVAKSWAMLDVFLLGAIVAIIKLSDQADVGVGPAFYIFVALIIVNSVAASSFDPRILWQDAQRRGWR